jgi:hypothetical protein
VNKALSAVVSYSIAVNWMPDSPELTGEKGFGLCWLDPVGI